MKETKMTFWKKIEIVCAVLGAIVAICAWIANHCFGPDVPTADTWENTTSATCREVDMDKCFDAATKRLFEANRKAWARFDSAVRTAGDAHFNQTLRNVDAVADECGEISTCFSITYDIAADSIFGGDRLSEDMGKILDARIIQPMQNGLDEIKKVYDSYVRELETNHRAFATEMMQVSKSISDVHEKAMVNDQLEKVLNVARDRIGEIVVAFSGAMIGAAFESVSIRATISGVKSIFTLVLRSASAKVAVSLGAAAADGPLPIGDIIGAVGLGLTAYDLYDATCIIPDRLRKDLPVAISNARNDARRQAVLAAEEMAAAVVAENKRLANAIKK